VVLRTELIRWTQAASGAAGRGNTGLCPAYSFNVIFAQPSSKTTPTIVDDCAPSTTTPAASKCTASSRHGDATIDAECCQQCGKAAVTPPPPPPPGPIAMDLSDDDNLAVDEKVCRSTS